MATKYLDYSGLSYFLSKLKLWVQNTFVAQEAGKGLSTNDYTDAEKTKLSGIAAGAEVNVQADWNEANSSSDAYILNKPTIPAAPGTLNTTATTAQSTSSSEALSGNITLHKVSKTGSYNDLSDKPIKGSTSCTDDTMPGDHQWSFPHLTDYKKGWYWIVTSAGTYVGEVCEIGDVILCISDYNSSYSASDFNVLQKNLISGTNIKTVNNQSILGSGNISVTGDCIAYPTFSIDNNGHLIMQGGDPRLFEIVNGHLIYTYQ